MKKIIILLLCCGVLISMVGCGGNTAPLPTESPPITVSETIAKEPPPVTAVEPTGKETVPIKNHEQASESTPTEPTTTVKLTEDIKPSEAKNTSEEKVVSQVVEIVTSTISQNTENETTVVEPTKEIVSEPEITQAEFDIN